MIDKCLIFAVSLAIAVFVATEAAARLTALTDLLTTL